ncbi:DMT family transporter [Treponema phagedenis]|uniref:DMT family transporter n=1 Tax=Treponema phagedenis TaxID=162 RepID=UPI0020906D72|nr:DMT family transporter [Treponema phagedenis]
MSWFVLKARVKGQAPFVHALVVRRTGTRFYNFRFFCIVCAMQSFSKQEIKSRVELLLVTLIWGSSFTVLGNSAAFFKPNFLLALRFGLSFVLLCIIFYKRLKAVNMRYIISGGILGAIAFICYSLQTIGILTFGGLPGRSAFLVAGYCVLVPFISRFMNKTPLDGYNISAAFICIIGIGSISLPALIQESGAAANLGDVFALLTSVTFSIQLVVIERIVRNLDAILLTIVQFFFAGLLALVITVLFEDNSQTVWNTQSLFAIFHLVVLCTAVAIPMQFHGQKNTPATTASLIYSLESLFALIISIIFTSEKPTFALFIGGTLIVLAIIISETKLSFLKQRPKNVTKESTESL